MLLFHQNFGSRAPNKYVCINSDNTTSVFNLISKPKRELEKSSRVLALFCLTEKYFQTKQQPRASSVTTNFCTLSPFHEDQFTSRVPPLLFLASVTCRGDSKLHVRAHWMGHPLYSVAASSVPPILNGSKSSLHTQPIIKPGTHSHATIVDVLRNGTVCLYLDNWRWRRRPRFLLATMDRCRPNHGLAGRRG